MTLDEAREVLGIARGATGARVREAYRIRARHVHPDRHPDADEAERRRLSREFARAREAHDILLLVSPDTEPEEPARAGTAGPDRPPSARSGDGPSSAARPKTRAERRAEEERARPRTPPVASTLRFDDFVRAVDAAGFAVGQRTRRYRDITRIVVWSLLGGAVAAVTAAAVAASLLA